MLAAGGKHLHSALVWLINDNNVCHRVCGQDAQKSVNHFRLYVPQRVGEPVVMASPKEVHIVETLGPVLTGGAIDTRAKSEDRKHMGIVADYLSLLGMERDGSRFDSPGIRTSCSV